MRNPYVAFFLLLFLASACVPARKMEECNAKNATLQRSNDEMAKQLKEMQARDAVQTEDIAAIKRQINNLKEDTASLGRDLRNYVRLNNSLNEKQDQLMRANEQLASNNIQENVKLRGDLSSVQTRLDEKEKRLNELDSQLKAREANNQKLQNDLMDREAKVKELSRIINQRDSALNALQASVTKALTGFASSGLTVEQRDGRVYVSLSEKLLFQSGKTDVDPRGQQAVKQLAAVLSQNPDLNVMVEGHTDNVPYKGGSGAIKDNWDLSVLRATNVVKILQANSTIDPRRISAAGHGQYLPKVENTSADNRAANRRTEISLAPKLDALYQLIKK